MNTQDIIDGLRDAREKSELLQLRHQIERSIAENKKAELDLAARQSEIFGQELQAQKVVEFYSQTYASWYATNFEKDKSFLTLSIAGLGFLVTYINLIKTVGFFGYLFFSVAAVSFLLCIAVVVKIFGGNAEYLQSLVSESDVVNDHGRRLRILDRIAVGSFYFGVLFSVILGVVCSINT